jgi:YrbI family 3-deoxy-D-manno-octulosonate 8-phosphate phosphatase
MIELAIFDFDGTFTNGQVTFNNNGEIIKYYNVKDGQGIKLLQKNNIKVCIISGYKENNSLKSICEHLKINYFFQNIQNKLEKIKELLNELKISFNKVSYMGDDINDLILLKQVEYSGCPKNSSNECLDIVNFVSQKNGGEGSVREFCEAIIEKNKRKKKIAGLICVKYNSTRLPFKNFRKFGNTTLLDIKIKKLLNLDFLSRVIINTESDYIINYITKNYENKKIEIMKRDIFYASDIIDNRQFCRNVVKNINEDYVLYSPVTMPFIREETYYDAYKILLKNKYDTIVLNADGKQGSGHKHENHKICFGFSMIKKEDIIKFGDFIGKNPYFMICNKKERMDIDYPEEFNLCLYHYFNKDAIYGNENNHSLKINSLYDLNEMSKLDNFQNNKIIENKKEVKLIDVTIRDGGFDNKWNWDIETVKKMLKCASETGIEYFEIGYLANENVLKEGDGHYRNVSFDIINKIVNEIKPKCKISVLFDAWRYDTKKLPDSSKSNVDLIRVVTYMDNNKLLEAIEQCKKVKKKGYTVSLNIMCASYFTKEILKNLKEKIIKNIEIFDYVYFADSYGSMEPKYIEYIFSYIKPIKNIKADIQIGFHIHNNGQIGMANMISSLDYVDIIDASFYGMGRGMGNVRLEDVVLYLIIKKKYNLNIEPFLNYLSNNTSLKIKNEIKNTIVGFLNIHPYRIRDFKDETSLYNLYCLLKNLSIEKKYDYLI